MQISPNVRVVAVPESDPMRPRSTNIYVVGQDQVLAIDSGEAIDKFKWMIRGYLAAIEGAEIALASITHHHFDHSGNLKDFQETLGAQVLVPDSSVDLLGNRLPATGVDHLQDGRSIDLGGGLTVQVLATPGHSPDSVCYYLEDDGVLFTGDTILGVGTTTVHDLAAYRASLRRLAALPNLKLICPGHGPLVHDAADRLRTYITHRDTREEQILAVLQASGPLSSWEIMLRLYTDIDRKLRRAADGNVRAHLQQLQREGRIRLISGKHRTVNPLATAGEKAIAHTRREIVRRAKRIEEEDRRRALAQQESPPQENWAEPPRYELVDING